MIPTIPTEFALRLAAERQRDHESRAARRRMAHELAATSCNPRRIDAVFPAVRRFIATLPHQHRRPVAPTVAGPTRCCAA